MLIEYPDFDEPMEEWSDNELRGAKIFCMCKTSDLEKEIKELEKEIRLKKCNDERSSLKEKLKHRLGVLEFGKRFKELLEKESDKRLGINGSF